MNQFIQRVANYIANVSCHYISYVVSLSKSANPTFLFLTPGPLKPHRTTIRYRCLLCEQEVFIKGLAESKTFQKFAVHTDRNIQKIKKEGLESLNSQVDELHRQATRAAYSTGSGGGQAAASGSSRTGKPSPPQKPGGFLSALGKVIRKDLGMDR